ncbi:hypothetical protein [Chlamydia avium]|uniref:Uncharacterized protein n=1 Tax=Chlamydia avium 10DC88 TaxID=1229831 RepID=W8JF47_9CHLA|nr:hypothetical protein [Chlamydia avium]AHK63156.1 Uncharacterized protein M832_02910 [Chlamydia avium 10DC88]
MDIKRSSSRHCFYIDKTDSLMRNPYNQDSGNSQTDKEIKKFLNIKKRFVTSVQEFQHDKHTASHYLKKVQWLPYKNEELEETSEVFSTLKSMERKLAQLFFYVPDCGVDSVTFIKTVREYESLFGLGGVLLLCGSLEQQSKYIQDFNQLTTLPLLIAASVSNSLSCYLSYRDLTLIDYQDFYELGQNLGKLIKTYGVFISLVFQEIFSMDLVNYSQLIQGLKSSGNIQGRLCNVDVTPATVTPSPIALRYSLANTIRSLAISADFSSLKFIGSSIFSNPESTVKFLNYGAECFIFSHFNELKLGIKTLTQIISSGRISPTIINKSIVKMLMLKRRFKSSWA